MQGESFWRRGLCAGLRYCRKWVRTLVAFLTFNLGQIPLEKCVNPPFSPRYVVPSIYFLTFFVQAFNIVVDTWKFCMLLLYILWDDWPIFMISGLNQQLKQQLEYTLLKPVCHSWWISKNAISTWGHFRRTICNKIVF